MNHSEWMTIRSGDCIAYCSRLMDGMWTVEVRQRRCLCWWQCTAFTTVSDRGEASREAWAAVTRRNRDVGAISKDN